MEVARFVSDVFGVTIVNAIGLLIFAFVGKTLFVKAADAAAARALEDKKSEFAKELEEIRQRFARDLEHERNAFQLRLESERRDAAQALEAFKADLALGAEVRRQVAAKRVQALEEIISLCEPLARKVVWIRHDNDEAVTNAIESVNTYMVYVRQHAHLFDNGVAEELYRYSSILLEASKAWNATHDVKITEDLARAYDNIMRLIRHELGINSVASRGAASPNANEGNDGPPGSTSN